MDNSAPSIDQLISSYHVAANNGQTDMAQDARDTIQSVIENLTYQSQTSSTENT